MAKFNNAKLQLLLHQPNKTLGIIHYKNRLKKKHIITSVLSSSVISNCATPWTASLPGSLSMVFPKQEHWSGLLFPTSGDLPDAGIEPMSCVSCTDRQILSH